MYITKIKFVELSVLIKSKCGSFFLELVGIINVVWFSATAMESMKLSILIANSINSFFTGNSFINAIIHVF